MNGRGSDDEATDRPALPAMTRGRWEAVKDWAMAHGRWLLGGVAVAMLSLLLTDELLMGDEPITFRSVVTELVQLALLVGTTVVSALLLLRVRAQEEESRLLRLDVLAVGAENRRWREEMADHLRELSAAIRRQFDAWSLTAAEQDVGLLLLKGLSHKEIARIRNTSEATIRQQAASLYQKANLSGRAALSAFFLEDLLTAPTTPQIEARERVLVTR
jgi:DNA-binding CsgD family transcriptional regulator